MTESLTKQEIKKIIMKELPGLIKKDLTIRNFILKLTSAHYADRKKTEDRFEKLLEELRRDREEWNKKWEENLKKWKENEKRWEENERRWQENEKKWEENQKVINRILEEIKLLRERQEAESKRLDRRIDTTIGALGARWGLFTEESFRSALKGILEESFNVKVERYTDFDAEGKVFGRPDQIEFDLIIYNNTLILTEIKSSVSHEELYAFWRKVQFYEEKHNKEVKRKIIISPMVEDKAKELAEEFGIEVYSRAEAVKMD